MSENKVKLLDLCCKAGGCSMGYYQAAIEIGVDIEITGIDIEPQPNYPFNFIQYDAVEYIKKYGKYYTHIHASPPCQKYSKSTSMFRKNGKEYTDILNELRIEMLKQNKPGVIENVPEAPIRPDIVLYGYMFGLRLVRKRHFELINWFMMQHIPNEKIGSVKNGDLIQVVGKGQLKVSGGKRFKYAKQNVLETWKHEMKCGWMKTNNELSEAIPPAYTKYIGVNFLKLSSNL